MTHKFAYDVFLSHNAKDKPRVRRLAERLKEAGLRVWFDDWNVRSGDIIALKVDEGLEQSRVLVLCISPNALASGWVALERSTAIHRDPSNEGRRFIPLLLADCDLPDTLRRYKHVDFRKEAESAFQEMVTACKSLKEVGTETSSHPMKRDQPTIIERLVGRRAGEKPAANRPKQKKKRPLPDKPSEQNEPLAVLEHKLTGHNGWVKCVAISPDGNWAASGSDDKTIKIWDLKTGKCRATLKKHTDRVSAVAITPDGKQILSASDNSIRIWDAGSGRELAKLKGHTGRVLTVVPLHDNARVLSGGYDDTFRLWDLASRSCLKVIQCGIDIFCSGVTRSGNQAVSGHRDGSVRLWNLETGECQSTLKGHSQTVNSIQITPDGRFAFSGSDDKTVRVWDLEAMICVGTLEGHQYPVDSVAISPDGALIASTGFSDSTVRLWDWKSGACLQQINEVEDQYTPISVAIGQDGNRLVVGNAAIWEQLFFVYIYHLGSLRPASSVEATRRYVNAKVVLLGEGTVGKTSLAHRLIEDKYVTKIARMA